jgi:hypothetical protein
MKRVETAISKRVWRKGWRREASATQAASAQVAAFIRWLEQEEYCESAQIVRDVAMRRGVRGAEAALRSALTAVRGKRGTST